MAASDKWNASLPYGHWAHGIAVAYDWLYHDLDEATRKITREAPGTAAGEVSPLPLAAPLSTAAGLGKPVRSRTRSAVVS